MIKKFLKKGRLDYKYYFIDNKEKQKLQEKIKLKNILNNLDLEKDNSITKFVNSYISFTNIDYKPDNLENIKSDYITDLK
jgi:hypothetical protein